jgi:hypothetical protein
MKWLILVVAVIATLFCGNVYAAPPNVNIGDEFLVFMGADWCTPCTDLKSRMTNPLARNALRFYKGVFYIDGDKYPKYVTYYKVKNYPTVIRLKRIGDKTYRELDRFEGAIPQLQLLQWLNKRFKDQVLVPTPVPRNVPYYYTPRYTRPPTYSIGGG